jgi:UDP-N-acetylglucosamine--dolichyl-phosphate N-acetylglucosaminephosphotransferase
MDTKITVHLAILFSLIAVLYRHFNARDIQFQFLVLAIFTVLSYFFTLYLIPIVKEYCLKADIWGKDLNKGTPDKIPESLGIAVGTVYLICVVCFQPVFHSMLGQYNAALLSVCLMLLLGFGDDVFNIRWAVKILSSFVASLPLIVAYNGPTNIVIPKPFRPYLGDGIELGYFYLIYMMLTTVFCTNSINIYAGINGLEAGQSLVIAIAIIIHNYLEIGGPFEDGHILSMFLILPFIAVTLGLLYFNWYPSQVFVGDSYTYFAGMTLAVAGILGRFSKTLMLFFIPELINFILSIPQLLNIIPCPNHRLPKLDPKTGKLTYSKNGTLINAVLYLIGPTHERTLCIYLLVFHAICCALAFAIRYSHTITNYFYDSPTISTKL